MAVYTLVIEKEFQGAPFLGEKWTNIYHCNTVTAGDAVNVAESIAALEMAVSYTPIMATRCTAFDPGNPADKALSHPNIPAALDPTGLGGVLPLFNTVRVVLGDSVKSAEQKYLRLGANAANIGSGTWDGEFVTAVTDDYATPLLGDIELRGPNDEIITSITVRPEVQMRQLGWSRRTRPGFHRGYVPN
jgi:hypothetical protein